MLFFCFLFCFVLFCFFFFFLGGGRSCTPLYKKYADHGPNPWNHGTLYSDSPFSWILSVSLRQLSVTASYTKLCPCCKFGNMNSAQPLELILTTVWNILKRKKYQSELVTFHIILNLILVRTCYWFGLSGIFGLWAF